jgi:hypothetical protein
MVDLTIRFVTGSLSGLSLSHVGFAPPPPGALPYRYIERMLRDGCFLVVRLCDGLGSSFPATHCRGTS